MQTNPPRTDDRETETLDDAARYIRKASVIASEHLSQIVASHTPGRCEPAILLLKRLNGALRSLADVSRRVDIDFDPTAYDAKDRNPGRLV